MWGKQKKKFQTYSELLLLTLKFKETEQHIFFLVNVA